MGLKLWRHHNVADDVHGIIRLTDLEHRIMGGPLFNRLHYVYQDSTVFFTWPAVRIQRFEHSLGCMHLAGQMFYNAIANADEEVLTAFVLKMNESLLDLIEQWDDLYRYYLLPRSADLSTKFKDGVKLFIETCCPYECEDVSTSEPEDDDAQADERGFDSFASFPQLESFSFLIPARVNQKIKYAIMYLAEGIRLAGMLHDLGHPPFSHVCESVLSSLYSEAKSPKYRNNYAAKSLDSNVSSFIPNGKNIDEIDLHEVIGNRLASIAISQAMVPGKDDDPELLFSFTSGLVAIAILNNAGEFEQMHALVCGTIDADRLDFVQRDSKASGVGTDALQYGRLVEGLRLIKIRVPVEKTEEAGGASGNTEMNDKFLFALPSKTLPTVEDFLRKRLSNYKTIVFHHRVVKSEELLKSILHKLAVEYFGSHKNRVPTTGTSKKGMRRNKPSDSYVLPHDVSGLWKPLAGGLEDQGDVVLSYSQWNDSWLLTMLRERYTRMKVDRSSENDELLLAQLAELLYSEKSYQTVVKRSGDCRQFREHLHSKIEESRRDLNSRLDECEKGIKARGSGVTKEGSVDAKELVATLRAIVNADESVNILREIGKHYSATKMTEMTADPNGARTFTEVFRKMVCDSLNEVGCEYEDVLVARNHIKTGIGGQSAQAYFYEGDEGFRELRDVSAVSSVLEREAADLPAYFTFVKCTQQASVCCRSEAFFSDLASRVHQFISTCVERTSDYIE